MKRVFLSLSILCVCVALVMADRSFAQGGNQKSGEPTKAKVGDEKTGQQTSPKSKTVIGHLHSRDRIVTVTQGPRGAVYTIKTKDGKILATKLEEKDLQAKYPDIYHQIKSGVAGNDATLR
jgi:hypothetical protein